MNSRPGTYWIGTSGYQYDHWKTVFYPPDLPKSRWFEHYQSHFSTVEINNTFYNLPKPETFADWRDRTPEGFCYALKMSRYATHIKRLKDGESTLATFFEHAEPLGDRIGPLLVQLPPKWKANPERLDAFLAAAPDDYRWVVEFRDPDWFRDEVYAVLRKHQAALCLHDMIEDHPAEITAPWVYLRFHGDHYAGSYSQEALRGWAGKIARWLGQGLDVYAYFNNDAEGHAIANAMDLRHKIEDALAQ